MPSTMDDNSMESDITTAPQDETEKPLVHAPRSVWLEMLLGVVTFSLSFCFWTVARAKDLKNMSRADLTPWLWFFVPWFGIFQLFGFHRMFEKLTIIEDNRVNNHWKKLSVLWFFGLCVSIVIYILSEMWLPDWTLSIAVAITIALYCLLHVRFNKLKNFDAERLEFYGKEKGYYWWEWLLIVLGLSIYLLFAYYYWDEYKSVIKSLPDSYIYINEEQGYQIQIEGNDWRQVIIGTSSDGSAEVEFTNESYSAYLLVFKHDINDTFNSIATFRYNDMQSDFNSDRTCIENRKLSNDQKSVISQANCSLETDKHGILSTSTLIKVDSHIYELLGNVDEDMPKFIETKNTLLNASNSFSPIVVNKAPTEPKKEI